MPSLTGESCEAPDVVTKRKVHAVGSKNGLNRLLDPLLSVEPDDYVRDCADVQ